MIEYPVVINGIRVDARFSERAVEEIFLPLLKRMTALQRQKGKRLLVMLAAPPGAGKSTLASFLADLSEKDPSLKRVQVLGMDGFHRRQEYLLTHQTERNGEEIPLVRIKGAPCTFDLEALKERVRRVAAGERCPWPVYDRLKHDPAEGAATAEGDIILIEGIYLILDREGWREIAPFADLTVFVRGDAEMLRERLIERRMKTGVDAASSAAFVDYSDMPNVHLVLDSALTAGLQFVLVAEGVYHRAEKGTGRNEV